MKPETRYCEWCQHHAFIGDTNQLVCAKGHKPRFYKPRTTSPMDSDWGWKRRCEDYERGDDVYVIPLSYGEVKA